MKSKTIILVALIFLGCSKENIECECDMKVYVSDGENTSSYIFTGVSSDCNGNVTEDLSLPGNHFPTYKCQ